MKIILQSNYFYLLLFFIVFLLFIFKKDNSSIYDYKDSSFDFVIKDFNYDDNKVSFSFEGDEKIIGTYYYKNKDIVNELKYGREVKVSGSLYKVSHNTIPNTFDYHDYLIHKGIYYGLKIKDINFKDNDISFIYKIKNYVFKRIMFIDKSGYMMAFILGDKSYLNKDEYKVYQNIGIAHLFALSGMHISLITGLLITLLKRINNNVRFLIVSLFLILYGFIVGFPASILRCIIFFIISSLNQIFRMELSNIKILLITAFVILFININFIYDSGFIYSFSCVFGILWSSKYIEGRRKIIRLSFVAFLFTVPVSLYFFYSINFMSIIYNLLFIPFVSMFVYPLAILSFIFPFLSILFNFSINILKIVALYFNTIPLGRIHLSFNIWESILFYILALLFIKKDNKLFLLLCLLIILLDIIIPYFDRNAYVYFLDVNQGDSCLVITPKRKDVIMIDTGGMENYSVSDNVFSFLDSLGVRRINTLILTHGDFDHMGEAINVVNNYKVDKVVFNCGSYETLEQELINVLNKEKIKYFSCVDKIDNLSILQTKEYDNENDNSNVIYTEIYGYKFMFMGDASITTEKEIMNKYNLPNIDVLKVGHHGSKTSSGEYFIDKIKPKYSIISVGKNNRYGHPNKEVLDTLSESNVYRTDEDGSVMFKIKNNKFKIEICNP